MLALIANYIPADIRKNWSFDREPLPGSDSVGWHPPAGIWCGALVHQETSCLTSFAQTLRVKLCFLIHGYTPVWAILSAFKCSPHFYFEQHFTSNCLRDEIVAWEENMAIFWEITSVIQALFQSSEPLLELQVQHVIYFCFAKWASFTYSSTYRT